MGLTSDIPIEIVKELDRGVLSQSEISRKLAVSRQYVSNVAQWRKEVLEQAEAR